MMEEPLPPPGLGWVVTSRPTADGTVIGRVSIPRNWIDSPPPRDLQDRWLTPAETVNLDRFRQSGDQWRLLAGRFLLRSCLRERFGIACATFAFGEYNKPMLAGASDAAGMIDLNLTHDRHNVLAAFSTTHDVGIDVAALDDFAQWEEFAGGYMAPREIAWTGSALARERPLRAMRIWTLKEAILKAGGYGLEIDPREICLTPEARHKIDVLPAGLPPAARFDLREWLAPDGMGAALARLTRANRPQSTAGQDTPAMLHNPQEISCTA